VAFLIGSSVNDQSFMWYLIFMVIFDSWVFSNLLLKVYLFCNLCFSKAIRDDSVLFV